MSSIILLLIFVVIVVVVLAFLKANAYSGEREQ